MRQNTTTWHMTTRRGLSAFAGVTVALMLATSSASAASEVEALDSVSDLPESYEAPNYATGDEIPLPDGLVAGPRMRVQGESIETKAGRVALPQGASAVVVDGYANETPAQFIDGALIATADTIPVTADGAEALGLSASDVKASSGCSGATNYAAPAGMQYHTSTDWDCYIIGADRYAKVTYALWVHTWSNGTACWQALGHTPMSDDEWLGAGCVSGSTTDYKTVTWGMVYDTPAVRVMSASYVVGVSGMWAH